MGGWVRLGALVVLLGATAAGCGGGDDASSTASSTASSSAPSTVGPAEAVTGPKAAAVPAPRSLPGWGPPLECVSGMSQAGAPPFVVPAGPDRVPPAPTVDLVRSRDVFSGPITPDGAPPVELVVEHADATTARIVGRSGGRVVLVARFAAQGGEWQLDGHEMCFEGEVHWQLPPPVPAQTPLRVEGSWTFDPPTDAVPPLDVVAIADVARASLDRLTPVQALNYGSFATLDADGRQGPPTPAVDVAAIEGSCRRATASPAAAPSATACTRHLIVDPATLTVLAEVTTPVL